MTQSAEERAEGETGRRQPCLCEGYARVTESAALAAARWLGSGDEASAEGEAVAAMRNALDEKNAIRTCLEFAAATLVRR